MPDINALLDIIEKEAQKNALPTAMLIWIIMVQFKKRWDSKALEVFHDYVSEM